MSPDTSASRALRVESLDLTATLINAMMLSNSGDIKVCTNPLITENVTLLPPLISNLSPSVKLVTGVSCSIDLALVCREDSTELIILCFSFSVIASISFS